MKIRVILSIGLFLWFFGAAQAYADTEACLGCHGDKEVIRTLGRPGAKLHYVDKAGMKNSVHGHLDCSSCHPEVSMDDHPKTGPETVMTSSGTCKNCHSVFKGIHATLAGGKTGNTACIKCHGAHAVKSMKNAKSGPDEDYCLNCHGKAMEMILGDGSKLSLKIDATHIDRSVHQRLSCSDCHFGFSSEAHPHRKFATRREITIALSDACRRCHFAEYTETRQSVHNPASKGNSAGAVCPDCHGAHAIAAASDLKAVNPPACVKCHRDTHDSFAASVHGTARIRDKNQDAPTCLNCHGTHAITDPQSAAFHQLVPEMCGKCHSDEKKIGKYGISSTVVKTYKQDFHGITLGFYKQKDGTGHPAVCTDCHGVHTIAGMDQPNSPRNRAYLDQRCRMCHPDAPPGFSAGSIPHYQAGFTVAPTVYAINLFYKMFIALMVVGLFIQIMLHIRHILSNYKEEKNHGK